MLAVFSAGNTPRSTPVLQLRAALIAVGHFCQARSILVRHTARGTRLPDLHAVLANHFSVVEGAPSEERSGIAGAWWLITQASSYKISRTAAKAGKRQSTVAARPSLAHLP